MFEKKSARLALVAALLAGIAHPGAAQESETVEWLGVTWSYSEFDNGLGLAGYSLVQERLSPSGGEGCRAAAERLYAELDAVEGASRKGEPLVLRTNQSLSYRLRNAIDLEVSVYQSSQAQGCGARITVFNPIEQRPWTQGAS